MTPLRVQAFSLSDRGMVREGNEDSLFRGWSTFAVADGMGGHQAGEVASETAIEVIGQLDTASFTSPREAESGLVAAIKRANEQVVAKAAADPAFRGMGTTLTVVVVLSGRLHLAHVGDSRAYLLREGELSQLTTDHTLVEQLVREGRLSRDEAAVHPQRSVITRAVGVDEHVDVDTLPSLELREGDQVLLCSDGLTGPLTDDEITDILSSEQDGTRACETLVRAANDAGGPDNITVVLLRVEPSSSPDGATDGAATGDLLIALPDRRGATREAPEEPRVESPPAARKRSRGRRVLRALGTLLVIMLLLAGAGAAGVYLLARAWFVGEVNGTIVIANGVPQQVAGISLFRVVEQTDLRLDEFASFRAERMRAGIPVASLEEGRRAVDELRVAPDRRGPPPPPAAPAPAPPPAAPAPPPAAAPRPRAAPPAEPSPARPPPARRPPAPPGQPATPQARPSP